MNRILVVISLILTLLPLGTRIRAEELNSEQCRRLVESQLAKTGNGSDSVGSPLRVRDFGERQRDFLLVPVIRSGQLTAVYRDDPNRRGVTKVASEAALKSTRSDLLSIGGATREFAERGFPGLAPLPVSFGPFSLFGAVEAGWLVKSGDSFMLLSFEGKLASEADIARFWRVKLAAIRQATESLTKKE